MKSGTGFYMGSAALTAVFLACTMATVSEALDTSLYSGKEQLDPGYVLYWQISDADASIRFAVKAKTSGYVGLGISEVGAMVGSDMIIGTVESGKAAVTDAFAYNRTVAGVVTDSQQDVKVISGEEYVDKHGDTWTVIEFTRKLNTLDCNDRPIAKGTNQIIWSMGATDVRAYHGNRRGSRQVAFDGKAAFNDIPADHEKYNLTAPAYRVPTNYTTYVCNTFNLSFPEKRHASSYSVIVNSNVPESVHHIVVHACKGKEMASALSKPSNTESGLDISCYRVIVIWAVGGKPVILPDNVGIPLGPGSPATIVVMQVHYTNPEGRSDIIDRSGISFTLAPQRRPIEAGIFPVGPYSFFNLIRIPPKEKSWKMESTCTSACTKRNIVGNIKIIGSTLHQHLIGKQIWTKLYRNNSEIATIGHADYYDFAFQTMVQPQVPIEVFPGDVLKTTCIWDSSSRAETTVGGDSTLDEMCMNYLLYYPLQENLIGGCYDGCLSPKAKGLESLYQPPFAGYGHYIQVCNDYTNITTNDVCKYGPTGGQTEVVPPLAGCQGL